MCMRSYISHIVTGPFQKLYSYQYTNHYLFNRISGVQKITEEIHDLPYYKHCGKTNAIV